MNQKKHPESKYKTHLYPGNGSENQNSNLSGTAFLDTLEMLSTRKTTNQTVLAAKFSSFY